MIFQASKSPQCSVTDVCNDIYGWEALTGLEGVSLVFLVVVTNLSFENAFLGPLFIKKTSS